MTQYNRRTLVRGAAWSIPVVAIAAHAPAFAASTAPPTVSGVGAYTACKQPGGPNGPNCQGYRMTLTFTVAAPYVWTVKFLTAKVDGTDFTASLDPQPPTFTVSSANPTVSFAICTASSPSQFDFDLTYSVERPGVAAQTIIAPQAKLTGVKNC
jgi:hypothetical protein